LFRFAEPPLILICIDKHTGSHHAFEETNFSPLTSCAKTSSIIPTNSHRTCPTISTTSSFTKTPTAFRLRDVLANLECRRVNAHDNGDHTIFVGQIEATYD
jgi:flavin reductase (DIM6/NTAB) family NADH-FMN oxidoreductase RutF